MNADRTAYEITISLTPEQHSKLSKMAKAEGYNTIEELISFIIGEAWGDYYLRVRRQENEDK